MELAKIFQTSTPAIVWQGLQDEAVRVSFTRIDILISFILNLISILSSFLLFGKELLEKNFKKTCQCKSCLHHYSVEISDTFLSFLSIDSVIVLILC